MSSDFLTLLYVFGPAAIFGTLGFWLAKRKNRSPIKWALICSITLYIGFIWLLILKSSGDKPHASSLESRQKVKEKAQAIFLVIGGIAMVLSLAIWFFSDLSNSQEENIDKPLKNPNPSIQECAPGGWDERLDAPCPDRIYPEQFWDNPWGL